MRTFYCVVTTIRDNGQCSCNIVDTVEAETKPENKCKSTSRVDITQIGLKRCKMRNYLLNN